MKIEIVGMNESHIDKVLSLALKTPELQINVDNPTYYSKKNLQDLLKSGDGVCFVAFVDGVFAGFRVAMVHSYFNEGYLSDIVVQEHYKNLGIGSMLYDKTMEELKSKECKWIWALVRDTNTHMQEFIEKRGFTKGEKFFFYYQELK